MQKRTEPTNQPKTRLAYTFHEAAQLLGVSYHSILRLNKRGLLKASNILRKKLIPAGEIERLLAATAENGPKKSSPV